LDSRSNEAQLNDPKPKKNSKGHLQRENRKTQELARKRQTTSLTKWKCNEKLNTPPTFLNASSPPLVKFIMFTQTSLNHPVSKRVLPLCAHFLPL
jgi:hypothetical protein